MKFNKRVEKRKNDIIMLHSLLLYFQKKKIIDAVEELAKMFIGTRDMRLSKKLRALGYCRKEKINGKEKFIWNDNTIIPHDHDELNYIVTFMRNRKSDVYIPYSKPEITIENTTTTTTTTQPIIIESTPKTNTLTFLELKNKHDQLKKHEGIYINSNKEKLKNTARRSLTKDLNEFHCITNVDERTITRLIEAFFNDGSFIII